jgi:cellulose biosynthesis protein BcsQ
MLTIAVYSEAGGVSKTTTAVGLAMAAAQEGRRVILIDLDPRAAATRWCDVQPRGDGLDISAIIGNADPDGWVTDLAVQADAERWSPNLSVVPSGRRASLVEQIHEDHQELRLRRALDGVTADLVVIDCPNRQGGPLTQAALWAAQRIVVPATPTADGREGVEGALTTIERHRRNLARLGVPACEVAGIVIGAVTDTIAPRIERHIIAALNETHGDLVLTPYVPSRVIVREAREAGEWWGRWRAGTPVVDAFRSLSDQLLKELK